MAALLSIDAVCQELIKLGENFNRLSKIGTPLQCAVGGFRLIGHHEPPMRPFPLGSLALYDRPHRSTIELLINAGADCTRDLPSQAYPWSTMGALALKSSEWADDFQVFAAVIRGGTQVHEDDTAVFRLICRNWSKHKDQKAKRKIQDIMKILDAMVSKKEGESLAYLKAFQKVVSETTDIDIPLSISEGISDDMLVQQMWKSINEDNLETLKDQSQSNIRTKDLLQGDVLTKVLDFAVTCSAVSCLDHLLENYPVPNSPHDWKSKAVLHYCVEDKKEDVLLRLLKNGAETKRTNGRGSTIWHLAASKATSSRTEREYALRTVNKSGRTPLAKALVKKRYRNASMLVKYCGKDHACLQSNLPSISELIAGIQDSALLKELHDSEIFQTSAKDSPLNHLEDSANVEAVRQLLEIFPYPCSDEHETPLRSYLSKDDLNACNKEIITLLVQKELVASPSDKSSHNHFTKSAEAEACEVFELVKLMIDLGCVGDYEKAKQTSGLKEVLSFFDVVSTPTPLTLDHDAVLATEEIFSMVHDITTLPQYYKSSGMDIKVIKWTIAHNSWPLFRRLIQMDVDVHKRDRKANLLQYVCSHGTGLIGHRMLVSLLERAERGRLLSELNPEEDLSLCQVGMLTQGGSSQRPTASPVFRPTMSPMSTFSQSPHLPSSVQLGPGGFAALRMPGDNPKFSLLQRLLDEQIDCALLSKRGKFSALSIHIRYGYLDTARLLLRRGSPDTLSTADTFGWTPVAWACAHGYSEFIDQMVASSCSKPIWNFEVEVTLSVKAAPSFIKPYRGLRALHLAVIASVQTVTFLLDRAYVSDLEIADAQLRTPLHFATFLGQVDTIRELVSRGSNINAKDKDGWTPLHFAIHFENEQITDLLLELGASHMKTKKGETPLDLAIPKINRYFAQRVEIHGKGHH
ncbi:ankyrin-2 ankyrin [Colletotrichum phormii]|uniref:Ankyrin-2 ankyrin n=1 Tax=Colletotrichum phormii TaxID=359342 RepID=A0AAI9ZL46_9PEZI|nr:ankyrin-2 ankyrin [Colletotrichum phormii]KAK1625254.1 ankyrin-2 ankyrin [Colletotrichum phormii]